MSLLSVTVKKAHYVGAQAASQFNSYVTLKLQNVKSTTVTVKGASPCWEQDFLFETNDLNTGLLIEVWSKGMIWDRAMGYHWLPLQGIPYTTSQEEAAKWLSLDAELVMRDGEVVGTKNPTGNSLLVECRFELPFGRCDPPTGWRTLLSGATGCKSDEAKTNSSIDPENIEASDLQKKLEMLNNIMDPEARAEQARRQMILHFGHSGYSEDSDYTSDLNYPVGQHANSSASQFRSAAHQLHTPQRSLETSRENSYERDDAVVHHHHYLPQPPTTTHHQQHHLSPGTHRQRHMQQRYSPNADDYGYGSPNVGNNRNYAENSIDPEPLSYNSRPRKSNYTSQDWSSHEMYSTHQNFDDVDSCNDYITVQPARRAKAIRRPSLERQTTLYDDYADINTYTTNQLNEISCNTSAKTFNQNTDDYYNTSSYPFQEERYGQDEEDRQWDSGGFYQTKTAGSTGKKLPSIPALRRSSVVSTSNKDVYDISSYSCAPTPTPGRRKVLPQIPTKRSASRQSSINDDYDGYRTPTESTYRGKSLPPTPTKTPKIMTRIMAAQNKPFNSLPPTPGRQLPKPNINNRNSSSTAKARRANLMKRTSSAEYTEGNDIYDSYYMRPGAMSARDNYNEDYNYAYQSTDNLPAQQQPEEEFKTTIETSRFTSTTVTTSTSNDYQYNNIQEAQNYQSDYYYDATLQQQKDDYYQNDANTKNSEQYVSSAHITYEQPRPTLTSSVAPAMAKAASNFYEEQTSKLKLFGNTLGNRLKSSLLTTPQTASTTQSPTITTSSSIHVAVSQQQYSYQAAEDIDLSLEAHDDELKNSFDTAISSITSSIANQQYGVETTTISSSYEAQYHRDQLDSPKAIVNGQQYPTSTADVPKVLNGYNRGFLQQQETIDASSWQHEDEKETYYEEDENYLLEEEETPVNGDYSNKAIINRESPASVIHVDVDEQGLRRGSSQLTVVDPYLAQVPKPATTVTTTTAASAVVDYPSRRPSMEPYSAAEEYMGTPPRKPSDSYADVRRTSRQSPELERQDSQDQDDQHLPDVPPPEEKRVSFEEEEELDGEQKPNQQRQQVTAVQRWHWAYNKIIMQLNVSF